MSCERFREALVARLYDELAPHEDERLSRHLESCDGCRRDLDELSEARRLLGQAENHDVAALRFTPSGAPMFPAVALAQRLQLRTPDVALDEVLRRAGRATPPPPPRGTGRCPGSRACPRSRRGCGDVASRLR